MTQYINKDIVMSQLNIELSNLRKAESEGYITEFGKGKLEGLEGIADFILDFYDKKVDLEKEIDKWIDDTAITHEDCSISDVISTARHFFELGVRVNNPVTEADRGVVDEIISALNALGKEKMISYNKEIEWLRNKVKKEENL